MRKTSKISFFFRKKSEKNWFFRDFFVFFSFFHDFFRKKMFFLDFFQFIPKKNWKAPRFRERVGCAQFQGIVFISGFYWIFIKKVFEKNSWACPLLTHHHLLKLIHLLNIFHPRFQTFPGTFATWTSSQSPIRCASSTSSPSAATTSSSSRERNASRTALIRTSPSSKF